MVSITRLYHIKNGHKSTAALDFGWRLPFCAVLRRSAFCENFPFCVVFCIVLCYNANMIKHCVICGAPFDAPPSSKKITCSAACSTKRKAQSHIGKSYQWSDDARKKLSQTRKAQGYNDNAKAGLSAAMSLPESQRGPQHRDAKIWVLIAPDDTVYHVINLRDWSRKHAHWFDTVQDDADRERIANNIRSGFCGIVQSMIGRKKHPCFTYKGWRLGDWPKEK